MNRNSTPAHLSESFLTSFLESSTSDCIVKDSADLPMKSKVDFLSTRVEQYDSNGTRIFLLREGCKSDIPNNETDLVLNFKEGDIVNKKLLKMVEGVDLLQLESTGRSKYVFLFNLVVGWRKKWLLHQFLVKIWIFHSQMFLNMWKWIIYHM